MASKLGHLDPAAAGLGDPSGCGLAMSYLRSPKRIGRDPIRRILTKQQATANITGTTADLRKLSNTEVGNLLKEKFNFDDATIKTLRRWERIGVLRELSNQAAEKGMDLKVQAPRLGG